MPGSKRIAPPTCAPPAKRAVGEQHVHDRQQCREVAAGLTRVEGLPRDVAKMLGDMLDVSLPLFCDERHELQERVVALGEKVLRSHESSLEAKLATANELVTQSEKSLGPQQKVVDDAEGAVKERMALELDFKRALAEAARAFQASKKALDDAAQSREAFDQELRAAADRKAKFECIQSEMVSPLAEGTVEEAQKSSVIETLVGMLDGLGLEQSIMLAIPACFGKAPDARGSFDTMVVAQLREELARRIAAAAAELERAVPTKAARVAVVEEAVAKVEAAKANQIGQAQDFRDTRSTREATEAELLIKAATLRELQKEEKKRRREFHSIEGRLSTFSEGVLATYTSLRCRSRPTPQATLQSVVEAPVALQAV